MEGKQSSYRQIIKATSIFGGVQVLNIIVTILRSKFVAVWLGPVGIGIAGLYISALGLIGCVSSFGLGQSAVRTLSVAVATEDSISIRTAVAIIRRLSWITGLLGAAITLFLSAVFSEWTFGNDTHSTAFVALSISLLLTQLGSGQIAVLQGHRKYAYLAKSEAAGLVTGLLVAIPLYYFLGTKGIVPAILVNSFVGLFFTWLFVSKMRIADIKVATSVLRSEGMSMLKMGIMLSLSGIIAIIFSYLLRIFIGRSGGVEQVGLYNAGFAIINTYVGMIFTAMVTDYYPRLTQVSHDNLKSKNVINEQAEVAILVIAPILVAFLTYIHWVVILLYSATFAAITGMLHWAALGMFFKTVSWAVGFIFLAKGSSRLYFWNELVANIYLLLLNVAGYLLWGIDGLGISFLVGYIIFFVQVYAVANKYYGFRLEKIFVKLFTIQLLVGVASFLCMREISAPYSYAAGSILVLSSFAYSFFELNKRIGLLHILFDIIQKIRKKPEVQQNF